MANPKFTSVYTGQDIESAIAKALQLDTFEYQSDELIDGLTFHVLWKVKPTTTNKANGIAVHPTSGKLFNVESTEGVISVQSYITEGNGFAEALNSVTLVLDCGTAADYILNEN